MSENARERKMCPSERQKFVEHDIKYVRRRNILSDEEAFMSYWIAICLKRFLRNVFELFFIFFSSCGPQFRLIELSRLFMEDEIVYLT